MAAILRTVGDNSIDHVEVSVDRLTQPDDETPPRSIQARRTLPKGGRGLMAGLNQDVIETHSRP